MKNIMAETLWTGFVEGDEYEAIAAADMEIHDADVLAQAALNKAVSNRQDFNDIDERITAYGNANEHFGFVNGVRATVQHLERLFKAVTA